MSGEETQVVVRSEKRAEADSVAYMVARTLEAAGASVSLASALPMSALSGDSLRGTQITVGVLGAANLQPFERAPLPAPKIEGPAVRTAVPPVPTQAVVSKASIWSPKFTAGLVFLLVLVFMEVRLRLGPAALLTLVALGGWVLWHLARRPEQAER